MKKENILELGNIDKIIRILTNYIPPQSISIIKNEKHKQVKKFIDLANSHYRFANNISGYNAWRQIVSRGYYACYCASRAIRLFYKSEYDTTPKDHENIGNLPTDFPNKDEWKNLFKIFRGDRNLSDYDHSASYSDLEYTPEQYLAKANDFLGEVKRYIRDKQ